jgi:hypothetical protein
VKKPQRDDGPIDLRDAKTRPASLLNRLRRDITITILAKLALLALLSFLCFSPSQRPHIDASAIALRILPSK